MRFLITIVLSVLFCEGAGLLSAALIPTKLNIMPWTLITLSESHPIETTLGVICAFLLSAVVYGYFLGGQHRIYSFILSLIIGVIVITLATALTILNIWQGISINSITQFIIITKSPELYPKLVQATIIGLSAPIFMLIIFCKDKFNSNNALGNAHFATAFEVLKAGFLKKCEGAILIGKKYGAPLWSNGFEHVLVFAPSGSGKTRSIAIPNLMQYPYSVVCNDVKLTIFKKTAQYRETVLGHKCFCWNPTSPEGNTHRYNPLSLISEDKRLRITDIQKIAHILIPDSKKSDPIWQQAARKLFKAMVLYLLDTNDVPTTLGEINRLLKKPSFDNWLAEAIESRADLDEACLNNANSYLNNHEKTRSSILETLTGYLELFEDSLIDAATSATDFDIRNLRREKMTIYIGFTDDDMERLSPLLNLFWQQLISAMIQKIPHPKNEPYPLLCLIDEFSSLGRIERLRRSLKLLREYRVRCVLMLQYIAQTYEQYSRDEAKAFTNIKTKIAFAPDDEQDAEYISKLLGTKTTRVNCYSHATQQHGYNSSTSTQFQATPLMRADEIMRLERSHSLIIKTGVPVVKARLW
ncbi:MAG: hypothetical protein CMJ94_02920 [Planctomycetes bacterium]|nr:hypothetical protein [Planctomycetota bacterium]